MCVNSEGNGILRQRALFASASSAGCTLENGQSVYHLTPTNFDNYWFPLGVMLSNLELRLIYLSSFPQKSTKAH